MALHAAQQGFGSCAPAHQSLMRLRVSCALGFAEGFWIELMQPPLRKSMSMQQAHDYCSMPNTASSYMELQMCS